MRISVCISIKSRAPSKTVRFRMLYNALVPSRKGVFECTAPNGSFYWRLKEKAGEPIHHLCEAMNAIKNGYTCSLPEVAK